MPRQARESSGTGIYHVMMRGINHQNIFEDQENYYQFLNTLDMMALSYEPDGTPSGRNYTDKVRLNCYYYHHYSFIKDIQMIFCTVLGKKMQYAGETI